ncbi:MAG: potassium-transporting ATPase subunit KdpA [Afipia sp.]|nr:potassium-transporting ATPase subunit KdpA [Afipia sp.]
MTSIGWIQIVVLFVLVLLSVKPLGAFMARVFSGERTFLTSIVGPLERVFYRLAGVDASREQNWRGYTVAMLIFNAAGFVLLYGLMRLQDVLPLNPQGFDAVTPDLAFNTAASFVTNTNWQAYGGETTMSHLVQMAGLTVQNFLSAATGIALALVFVRALARSGTQNVGNFWVDVSRTTLYVLLPFSIVIAFAYIATGLPQTLVRSIDATTLEGAKQTISLGPVASQEAIKQFGTNGGGFFNANAAHPFENATAISNAISIWAMLALSAALPYTFGKMVGDTRQGWSLLAAMLAILVAGVLVAYWAEAAGNPLLTALGVDPSAGNMEGKEVRFGTAMSALYAVVTTGLSCGAVNAMHDSFTPLGGLIPLVMIQLGEVLPGGTGSGLYGMLVFAVVAVFIAGLMVGRTPEYLGKKIEGKEMKLAMLALLILPLSILGFAAVAIVLPAGLAGLNNNGAHGLSEILYAYSSATGNNGSAFAGLSANSLWYNLSLGFATLIGRFGYVVPVMALAGSLVSKTKVPASEGTFPTHTPLFVALLVGSILIITGLEFFPALALGPIVEHFQMLAGKTF